MGSQAPLKPGSVLPKHIHGYGKGRPNSTTISVQGVSQQTREILRCLVAVSDSSITLVGNQTLDGVTVPEGSTVLVYNRSTASENGIYQTSVGAWTRVYSEEEAVQLLVHIVAGTDHEGDWFGTVDGQSFVLLVDGDDLAEHAALKATASATGHVKVDGDTIVVDGAGGISVPDGTSVQKVRVAGLGIDVAVSNRINFAAGDGLTVNVLDEVTSDSRVTIEFGIAAPAPGQENHLLMYNATGDLAVSMVEVYSAAGKVRIPWFTGDTTPTLYVGSDSVSNTRNAIVAESGSGIALSGEVFYGGAAIKGYNGVNGTTGWLGHTSDGVRGEVNSSSFYAVHGINPTGSAVAGETTSGFGVYGSASGSGTGIRATSSSTGPAIDASSSFTGVAVKANSARAQAGYFSNNSASNTAPTLQVDNNTGSAESIYVYQAGSGRAATIQILNGSNSSTALVVSTTGSGKGLEVTTVAGFGVSVTSGHSGAGIYSNMTAGGSALYGYRDITSASLAVITGEQANASCSAPAIYGRTVGTGPAFKGDGQLDLPYRSTTASVTLNERDVWIGIGTITATITITLPSASTCARRFIIAVDEAGTANATRQIVIARSGTDTINGGTSAAITAARGALRLYSNGSNWFTF